MSICSSFLAYDLDDLVVKWTVPVDKIVNELVMPSRKCKDMMREYVSFLKSYDYDPSKFGKAPLSYEALSNNIRFTEWVNDVKRS